MNCTAISQNSKPNSEKRNIYTDPLWTYLFLMCLGVLIVITAFSMAYGNYTATIHGVDSFGNICNTVHNKHFEKFDFFARDTIRRPYLVHFDTKNYDGVVRICSASCPSENIYKFEVLISFTKRTSVELCTYDFNIFRSKFVSKDNNLLLSRRGPCPLHVVDTIPYKYRCLPHGKSDSGIKEYYSILNSGGWDQLFFIEVYQSWYYVVFLLGFALVISLIQLLVIFGMAMFLSTKILVWLIFFLTITANVALCFVLWLNHDVPPKTKLIEKLNPIDESFYMNWDNFNLISWDFLDDFRINNVIIFGLVVLTSLTTVILISMSWILLKHLDTLKFMFDKAIFCIKKSPRLWIAPFISLHSILLLSLLTAYTLLCLTNSKYATILPTSDPEADRKAEDLFKDQRILQQFEYVDSYAIRNCFWIYFIGILWVIEVIFAFQEIFIGTTVAFWYNMPPTHRRKISFQYYFGSIAKGSAMFALLKFPRLIFNCIFKGIKDIASVKLLQRLRTLEKFFGGLNPNAYVVVAMERINLFQATGVVWDISNKFPSQLRIAYNFFDFVLFLSEYFVATVTCIVGILLLKDRNDIFDIRDRIDNIFFMPSIVFSALFAFYIARCVFSVFATTVDVLLLCAFGDQNIYGGLSRNLINTNSATLFGNNRD